MSEILPIVYLARHGDTAWTVSGQHQVGGRLATGLTGSTGMSLARCYLM
jgi:hypothetical protein